MKHVGVARRDRLWNFVAPWNAGIFCQKYFSMALGGCVAVMGTPLHLSAGDDIDTGQLLLQHRGLGRPVLGVGSSKDIDSWPTASRRSSASYQSGTLCAPITVVVYLG